MDFEKCSSPSESPPVAILALTKHGANLALQLQSRMPGSVCYVPVRHRFALAMGAVGFDRLADALQWVWPKFSALICIMATGIVVRQIAPHLSHKKDDPAVVVLDERGKFVISLVSGHLGGANRLARHVARLTGGQAVVTTATDVQNRPALDLIAREAGLEIENFEMLSRVARALLEEEPLWIYDPEGRLRSYLAHEPSINWLTQAPAVSPPSAAVPVQENLEGCSEAPDYAGGHAENPGVWVSETLVPPSLKCLVLRPRNLVVGIGCNRGTPAGEILDLLREVFLREKLSAASIRNLSSIDLKADETGLLGAAAALQRPVYFYPREAVEKITVPNPSEQVARHIGVSSVCEATALLSARSQTLIVPKQKTLNVTLAVARVACPL